MAWAEKHGSGWRVRFPLPDGSLGSETGFATKTAAQDRAHDIDSDQRRGTFVDPRAGQTTLREWVAQWEEAHDVSAGTWAKYRSHLRNHILPKFGDTGLAAITRITVKAWVKALRRNLAERTVADIVFLLSTLMSEAIDEGLIGNNPCRKLRINIGEHTERATLTAPQVEMLAHHAAENSLLVVSAAYTGMRWGELAGLQWHNVDLDEATIAIDPGKGALHEVHGRLELGPPKTAASVRTVHLPASLVTALTAHQDTQHHEHVFTGADGGLLRRSNFRRRHWRPALVRAGLLGTITCLPTGEVHAEWTDQRGHEHTHTLRNMTAAVTRIGGNAADGIHFHDLRHTHKTWMIEDDVPEVAQCRRLGHKLGGIRGVYSHVTQPMIDALLAGMQSRWEAANTPVKAMTSTDLQ